MNKKKWKKLTLKSYEDLSELIDYMIITEHIATIETIRNKIKRLINSDLINEDLLINKISIKEKYDFMFKNVRTNVIKEIFKKLFSNW